MSSQPDKNVPERLLNAAENLFCEKGYDETSVRDLTSMADCNIASVNYHFGGKDKLYIEMFRRHFGKMIKVQTENINTVMNSSDPTLEKLIRTLAVTGLEPLKHGKPEKSILRLMIREALNPQMPEQLLPQEMYKNLEKLFIDSIVKLTPGISREQAILSRFSFDGVMVFVHLFNEIYYTLFPNMTFEGLIDHIVKFTCAGIRASAEDKNE